MVYSSRAQNPKFSKRPTLFTVVSGESVRAEAGELLGQLSSSVHALRLFTSGAGEQFGTDALVEELGSWNRCEY